MKKISRIIFTVGTMLFMVVFVLWSSIVTFEPKLDEQKSDEEIKSELLNELTGGKAQAGTTPQAPEYTDEISSESHISTKKESSDVFDSLSSVDTKFKGLSSEEQLSLLISYARKYVGPSSEYEVYMGTQNYIVVLDKSGLGGPFSQSFAIKDNHDGTFDFYGIYSDARSTSERNKTNSYWKKTKSASESELLQQIDTDKSKLNDIISKIDLSKSNDVFSYLPVDSISNN